MHICFLTSEYPKEGETQGGIGSVVQTLARKLIGKEHKVSVVCLATYKEEVVEDDLGVVVHRLKAGNWKIARFIDNWRKIVKKLYEIQKDISIDIIEGSELYFAFIPKSFPAKKVIRMHGGHNFFAVTLGKKPRPWRSFQEKLSFSKADGLIAVSDFVGNKTRELIHFKHDFTTIYNIIDTTKFYSADREKVISKKIVFVGTLVEKKGVRQLVQAMPKIVDKFPEATLDIIGRDWHDPDTGIPFSQVLQKTIASNVEKNINIIGSLPHDEIPKRLESAEVCVYPSHMEAMPIAWLEALGMEKPVVASLLGPGPEAVIDKKTGLLCNPLDPLEIAKKINYMLENPIEAEEMGRNARNDILNRFDSEKIIQQNINFYQSLL